MRVSDGDYEVVRSVMVPARPVPETDAQRREREARGLPQPVFRFVVESVREVRGDKQIQVEV